MEYDIEVATQGAMAFYGVSEEKAREDATAYKEQLRREYETEEARQKAVAGKKPRYSSRQHKEYMEYDFEDATHCGMAFYGVSEEQARDDARAYHEHLRLEYVAEKARKRDLARATRSETPSTLW